MDQLKIFQTPEFGQVRTAIQGDEVLFCATDIAKCLGYANPQRAIRIHCKSVGVTEMVTPTNGGVQKIRFITKGNVIRLVASSTLPKAEKIESWIFDEVIPSVLNTGGYIATRNNDTPEEIMARAILIAQDTINRKNERIKQLESNNEKLQKEVENQKPLVTLGNAVMKYDNDISIGEMAKILDQNGYPTGDRRFREILKRDGFLLRDGLPSQKARNMDVLAIIKGTYETKYGRIGVHTKPVVTPNGQMYFTNKYLKNNTNSHDK